LAIPVSQPVRRVVADYVEYTGRTDAVQSVGIRARVTGYLMEVPFKEGAEINKGDHLFGIFLTPVFYSVIQWFERPRTAPDPPS
jgi:hypothetical protein